LQVLEFAGAAAALAGAKTADAVVIGMLAVRLSGVAGVFGYLALRQRWVIYGEADPLTPWVRSLIRPSLGFVIMPISQSLSLQGTLLVVGHFLGPMSVAVLSTARTLARLVETALSMIYNLVYEEVGYAAGAGDRPGLRRIIAWSTAASMLTGLGLSVALLSFGPVIYRYWTHGKIALDYGVLTAVVIASLVRALLTPAAAVLAGLNQHGRYSVVLFGATVASLALAVLVNRTGLVGIASTAIVMEVLIAVYALPRGLAAAGTSIQDIIADLRDPAGLRRLLSRRSGGRSQPAE
jgi:O-antigen/teichoic acid export membrane protein